MAIPTFLVGLLPTYAQIGLAAPALLTALRLLQGLCGTSIPGVKARGNVCFGSTGNLGRRRH